MIWNILPNEMSPKLLLAAESGLSIYPWQKDFTQIVLDYVDYQQNSTCIDIGANYGFLTRHYSLFFENVHSFEMHKGVYDCLVKNVADLKNVKTYNVALYSEKTSDLTCTDMPDHGGNRIRHEGEFPWKGIMSIQAETLDSYKIQNIDLIKIDVEGSELKVLEGSIETLKNNSPTVVVELLNQRTFSEYKKNRVTIELLFSLGYEILNVIKHDYILKKRVN